jgi:hypothetical protein
MADQGWNDSPSDGSLRANKQSCQEGPVFRSSTRKGQSHPRPPQSHLKATSKPYTGHRLRSTEPPQSHPKAPPRLHQGSTKATLKPPQSLLIANRLGPQSHTKATSMRPSCDPHATPKPGQGWSAGPGLGGFPLYSRAKPEEAQLGTATGASPSSRQPNAGRGLGSTAVELRKFPRKTRRLLPLLPQGRRGLGRGGPNEFSCR